MDFKNYSMTYTGTLVTFIMALSAVLEVDLDEGAVTELVRAALLIVGFLTALYGRWRKGDLTWFGKRK